MTDPSGPSTGAVSPERGHRRTARRLAWGLWGLSMVLTVVQLVLVFLARHVHRSPGFGFPGFDSILTVVPASVGALVASRQPSNPIGWIFVAVGVESGVQGSGLGYALNGLLGPHGPWPGAVIGAWLNAWLWFPTIIAGTAFVFLLFPSGRYLSARWRSVGWMVALATVVTSLTLATTPGPLENFGKFDNPFAVHSSAVTSVGDIGFMLSNFAILAAAVSLAIRYRRATQTEREQIKWLAYAGVIAAVTIPAGDFFLAGRSKAGEVLIILSILFIPVSIGIAILRYRLYDIDRIISRSVSYAVVTGVLGGIFAVVVLVPTAVLGAAKRPDWLVAAGTLAAAALFRPIRQRVQNTVDHRFNRARYDAAHTIEEFSSRLRDEIDLETLHAELADVIDRTMRPSHVSLWVRGEGVASST